MKRIFAQVIKNFLPKYEVVCTNYQLIPGLPVNRNESRHTFEKGAAEEALAFYGKVISSEFTINMAPVEIQLKKRGRTIQTVQYGPVENIKLFKMSSSK